MIVLFFLRGFKNLDRLAHAQTVMGAVIAVRHFEIHAPLSDMQTAVGLLFSGGQIWGPYLLNAAWFALVLVAIVKATRLCELGSRRGCDLISSGPAGDNSGVNIR